MSARTYDELFEPTTWHLRLERESDKFWVVTDTYNPDTPMLRSADRDLCVRFMRAFSEKTVGASYDEDDVRHSWRVAQESRPSNVLPFVRMHEQIDEAS